MRGGAHELGSRWIWAHGPIGPDLLARRHGDDPAALRAAMGRLVADLDRASMGDLLATLPLADLTDAGSPTAPLLASFGQQVTDPEWAALRLAGCYDRVQVPVLHVGGWYDVFLPNTLAQYRATAELAAARGTATAAVGGRAVDPCLGRGRDWRAGLRRCRLRCGGRPHRPAPALVRRLPEGRDAPADRPPGAAVRDGGEPLAHLRRLPRARCPYRRLVPAVRGWCSPVASRRRARRTPSTTTEGSRPTVGGATLVTPSRPAGPRSALGRVPARTCSLHERVLQEPARRSGRCR